MYSYYGAKISVSLFIEIEELFKVCKVVSDMFDNKYTEFIREAIRMNIQYYFINGENTPSDELIEEKIGELKGSQINKKLIDSVEDLFYIFPNVRRRFNSKKSVFIREAIRRHVTFWFNICQAQLKYQGNLSKSN